MLVPRVFRRLPASVVFLFHSVYNVCLLACGEKCGHRHGELVFMLQCFSPAQSAELPKNKHFLFPLVVSPRAVGFVRLARMVKSVVASRSPSSLGCSTKLTTTTTGTYITQSSSRRLLRRTVRRWRTSDWRRHSTSWTWTTPGTYRGIT